MLVVDCGVKYNILRLLQQRGCEVTVVPAPRPPKTCWPWTPEGILLSPGPGDPRLLDSLVANVAAVLGRLPVMGICLGHQVVARALGADTYKLKFGHRGGNHPVQDLDSGRVYITAQNHGYAVRADSLPSGLEVSHLNLNDGTVEGFRHRDLPLLTIQYHSEASRGRGTTSICSIDSWGCWPSSPAIGRPPSGQNWQLLPPVRWNRPRPPWYAVPSHLLEAMPSDTPSNPVRLENFALGCALANDASGTEE